MCIITVFDDACVDRCVTKCTHVVCVYVCTTCSGVAKMKEAINFVRGNCDGHLTQYLLGG